MPTVHISELPSLVGKDLPPSQWILVDQDMVNRFAEVTFDQQWIHVDVTRATAEIGGPIAHGFLTVSLMSRMAYDTLQLVGVGRAVNYGFEKLRFTGVVPVGSRIRMQSRLESVAEKSGGFLMTRVCTVEVELPDGTLASRPALVADWLGLVYPA